MANGFTKYWNKASDYLASDDRFYKPLWNYLLNGFTEYWNKASDYLASDNRFYKPFWNYLLLATYKWGNLLDYGSLNRTVDGNFIIEGASTKEGKLYRALTNEEKDEIIKAKRDAILRAIKEKDKEHYRAKVALFLFAIAFSIGVAFGSAAMMSHKFLDIMNHYDVALGLGEPFIAYAVFGIVFLVNVFIYFISVLSVSRMLFGHGFLSGLKLKEEAKVGINKNNEFVLRTNAEKKAEQTGQLAEGREAKDLSWDQFALQVVGMFFALVFSMSLAVLTRVNSKGGLEDMMGLAAATDASYAIAIVTLVGMFCLTSWAILGLVRVENKYQEFWKFCANVIGIDKANEITSPKKLWDNYDWRKHLVTLVIVVLFTLLCIYGLGSQGFAQAEAFTDQTQKQAGFFAASVSTTLCMLSALFGKGAFVIKAIGNSVGLYRNARSEPAKDENGNT